jgi:hypothetical protein
MKRPENTMWLARLLPLLPVLVLLIYVVRTGRWTGVLFGLPYDLRPPTLARVKERVWNPADSRLLTPMVFGWGYTVNAYELGRRLGLIA